MSLAHGNKLVACLHSARLVFKQRTRCLCLFLTGLFAVSAIFAVQTASAEALSNEATQANASATPVLAQLQIDHDNMPVLAVIIDDIGNNYELGKRAIELPGDITYAILPDTPQGKRLAKLAAPNKEIILHMPMQAQGGQDLGSLGLTDELEKTEFSERLRSALSEFPNATGVSNHMGSHLTRKQEKMEWLMAELQPRNLFFVDSKTTTNTAAYHAARTYQVPYIARDVFLDHHPTPHMIEHYYKRAVQSAKRDGMAVLIGHPYHSSLSFLEKALPALRAQGVKLVSISTALQKAEQDRQLAMNARSQRVSSNDTSW